MNSNISPHVQQAILKAMSAKRDDRPRSVGEFWMMLKVVDAEGRGGTIQLAEPLPETLIAPLSPTRKKTQGLRWRSGHHCVDCDRVDRDGQLGRQSWLSRIAHCHSTTVAVALLTAPPQRDCYATVAPTTTPTTAPATVPPTAKPPIASPNPPRMPEQVDALD